MNYTYWLCKGDTKHASDVVIVCYEIKSTGMMTEGTVPVSPDCPFAYSSDVVPFHEIHASIKRRRTKPLER